MVSGLIFEKRLKKYAISRASTRVATLCLTGRPKVFGLDGPRTAQGPCKRGASTIQGRCKPRFAEVVCLQQGWKNDGEGGHEIG
jgi:hypothetical protein